MRPDEARRVAEQMLAAPLPRRWNHVCGVAAKAAVVAEQLGLPVDVLVTAAWLHDVGYSPEARSTGLHALDGGRFLRGLGVDERVVALVAHHSCASLEADERGLMQQLHAEFPPDQDVLTDALIYCDMTTGPDGVGVDVTTRLDEIRARYGPEDVVTRFIGRAAGTIKDAVRRTESLLERASSG